MAKKSTLTMWRSDLRCAVPPHEAQVTLRCSAGFTLIELMIVVALIAGLVIVVIPKASSIDRLRTAVRRLTVITKEAQTSARLTGSIYRLIINMPPEDDKKESPSFWVEVSTRKDIVLQNSDASDKDKKEGEDTTETGFAADSKITKKKESLPGNFTFEDVEFSEKDKITSGKAYIYFFPQGFVTKAAIHISNRKKIHWTIVLNSLTGYGQVLDEYKSIKDLQ